MENVYLDTNFFVELYEGDEKTSRSAWTLIDLSQSRRVNLVTSELTIAEVLIEPMKKVADSSRVDLNERGLGLTPATLASLYLEILSDREGLSVVVIDRSILVLSAQLRAETQSLKLPDAIHLATAQQQECEIVVSGDKRLRPTSSFSFRRVGVASSNIDQLTAELA